MENVDCNERGLENSFKNEIDEAMGKKTWTRNGCHGLSRREMAVQSISTVKLNTKKKVEGEQSLYSNSE